MQINALVRKSGKCNADGVRIPLITKINVPFCAAFTKGSEHFKIVKYLEFGWPLGHDGTTIPPEPKHNHRGVINFEQETRDYLIKEKTQSRVFGPHSRKQFEGKNGISPLNSVPRKNDSKRRFVLDLSFPKGRSINDGIDKNWYEGEMVELKYPSVDDLVDIIIKHKKRNPEQRVLIWKRDLKSCYRQFQLCPGSVHLVGYKFDNQYWYDLVLAMGSSSSAQICQKITDLIRYIFENRYHDEVKNFLDDFFSAQVESEAEISFNNLKDLLRILGIEESLEKACPPNTRAVVLGILFDTITMTLSLTEEKMREIIYELQQWVNRTSCTLRQMQSLVGKLNFAAGVVRSGRIYMSRLINTLRNKEANTKGKIELSPENLNDVQWWLEHIKLYNGIPIESKMVAQKWEAPGSVWNTDSSATGLGGWSVKTGKFFHYTLEPHFRELDINSLECLALMLCVRKWAKENQGKRILINCDNQTTVTIVNSGASRNKFLQACLRELHHLCALNSTEIRTVWIKTADNSIADALSRWDQSKKYQEQFALLTKGWSVCETKIEKEDLEFKFTSL